MIISVFVFIITILLYSACPVLLIVTKNYIKYMETLAKLAHLDTLNTLAAKDVICYHGVIPGEHP